MSPRLVYIPKKFNDNHAAVIDAANMVLAEYAEQGYDLTLRQLYYQFVSRGWIANSDREYKKLGGIINDARLAGKLDWEQIVDRTRFLRTVSSWKSPADIVLGAANGYKRDLWAEQPVRIEVWVEKDALVGVIERACEDLRVPFLSCRGYTSQSEMWSAAQRLYRHVDGGQRVKILHLGDHDPSGIDMSRDIEERILRFLAVDRARNDILAAREETRAVGGLSEASEAIVIDEAMSWAVNNFGFERLALNWEQVEQYSPPPNPAKLTDSRGASYVEEYGNESWELDALEPTVIGQLISDAVIAERDEELWEDAVEQEEEERASLLVAAERWSDVAKFLA